MEIGTIEQRVKKRRLTIAVLSDVSLQIASSYASLKLKCTIASLSTAFASVADVREHVCTASLT